MDQAVVSIPKRTEEGPDQCAVGTVEESRKSKSQHRHRSLQLFDDVEAARLQPSNGHPTSAPSAHGVLGQGTTNEVDSGLEINWAIRPLDDRRFARVKGRDGELAAPGAAHFTGDVEEEAKLGPRARHHDPLALHRRKEKKTTPRRQLASLPNDLLSDPNHLVVRRRKLSEWPQTCAKGEGILTPSFEGQPPEHRLTRLRVDQRVVGKRSHDLA